MIFKDIEKFKKNGTIGIVGGGGRMGKWAIDLFSKLGYKNILYNNRTKKPEITKAQFIETKKEIAQKSDWIIISVPISNTLEIINEIGPFIKKETIFSDFTSIKSEPCKKMAEYSKNAIGIHPMFKETVKNLQGKNIVITPTNKKTQKQKIEFLQKVFQETKAKIRIMSAKKHDKITSFNQTAVHLILILYGELLKSYCRKNKIDLTELEQLETPNSKLMNIILARFLTTKNYDVIWNIQNSKKETTSIRKRLKKEIEKLIRILNSKNKEQFISEIESISRKFKKSRIKLSSDDSDLITNELLNFSSEKHFEDLYQETEKIINKELNQRLKKIIKENSLNKEHKEILNKLSEFSNKIKTDYKKQNIKETIYTLSNLRRFISHTILKGKRRLYEPIRNNRLYFEGLNNKIEKILKKLNELKDIQKII